MAEAPEHPSPVRERELREAAPASDEPAALRSRWWLVAAALLFTLALAPAAGPVLRAGADRVAAVHENPLGGGRPASDTWRAAASADLRFVIWQVSRNARTLLTRPQRIFDGEMCFPAEKSLAFGDSGITVGVLGIPAQWLIGDPVVAFNSVAHGLLLLSAAAMFLLVRAWTALPAAGLVAAVLYAFHWNRASDLVHIYVRDNVWTVLALFFAYRLFERRRLRDALGLAAAGVLQLGGSLYPLAAAALVAPLFAGWLAWRFGLRHLPAAHLALVAGLLGAGAALLLGPYLGLEARGTLDRSSFQLFYPLSLYLPGSPGFPGWSSLLLIGCALLLPASRAMRERANPRFVLGAAALLVIATAVLPVMVPDEYVVRVQRDAPLPAPFPNLYLLLERFVPGLDLGRGPGSLVITAHMLLALLAGLGSAALLRSVPARARLALATALVGLVFAEATRPAWLGFEPWQALGLLPVRPADSALALYAETVRADPDGALLEVPGGVRLDLVSSAVLHAAYHRRPTSQCYSAFRPPVVERVERLIDRLPDVEALSELRDVGFTSLVVHHPGDGAGRRSRRARFQRFAAGAAAGLLEPLAGDETLSAYRIRPAREPAGSASHERGSQLAADQLDVTLDQVVRHAGDAGP